MRLRRPSKGGLSLTLSASINRAGEVIRDLLSMLYVTAACAVLQAGSRRTLRTSRDLVAIADGPSPLLQAVTHLFGLKTPDILPCSSQRWDVFPRGQEYFLHEVIHAYLAFPRCSFMPSRCGHTRYESYQVNCRVTWL
jgi:hypothetical protein